MIGRRDKFAECWLAERESSVCRCVQLCVSAKLYTSGSVGHWLRHRWRPDTTDDTAEQVAMSGSAWRTTRGIVRSLVLNYISSYSLSASVTPSAFYSDACSGNLHEKFYASSSQLHQNNSAFQPIALHGSCHVPDSFCAGIKLCSIECKQLVPEKLVPDWPTQVQVSGTRRLVPVSGTSFLSLCHKFFPPWFHCRPSLTDLEPVPDLLDTGVCFFWYIFCCFWLCVVSRLSWPNSAFLVHVKLLYRIVYKYSA